MMRCCMRRYWHTCIHLYTTVTLWILLRLLPLLAQDLNLLNDLDLNGSRPFSSLRSDDYVIRLIWSFGAELRAAACLERTLTCVDEIVLYTHSDTITDLDVFYEHRSLYFSDAAGQLHLFHEPSGNVTQLFSSLNVGLVSVDWLYGALYISSGDQIFHCGLTLEHCQSLVTLTNPVIRLLADPYNGFVYWIEQEKGVVKYDMMDIGKTIPRLELVINTTVHTISVSFNSYDLYSIRPFNGSMADVCKSYLNGESTSSVLRLNRTLTQFDQLTCGDDEYCFWLETRENTLVWYLPNRKNLSVISGLSVRKGSTLKVWHSNTQPRPFPRTSPDFSNILMNSTAMLIQWRKPDTRSYLLKLGPWLAGLKRKFMPSDAAWSSWFYELSVVPRSEGAAILITNLTATSQLVSNLLPNTAYNITVLAYTDNRRGEANTTLRKTFSESSTLVLGYTGRVSTVDLFGTVLSTYKLPTSASVCEVSPVDKERFYLLISRPASGCAAMSMKQLVYLDLDARAAAPTVVKAGIIAITYDWIGQKIYWSDNDVIARGPVNETETILDLADITEAVLHMVLDSLAGTMYWSSSKTIESCRIGLQPICEQSHMVIDNSKPFISLLIGPVLDYLSMRMYWAEVSSADLTLQSMSLTNGTMRNEGRFAVLSEKPFAVFGSKLMFLADSNITMFSLETAINPSKRLSVLGQGNITSFSYVSPSFHPLIAGMNDSNAQLALVHPTINLSSVEITGLPENFTVKWETNGATAPTIPVYFNVTASLASGVVLFYDPKGNNSVLHIMKLSPHTHFRLSILPYTPWGTGERVDFDLVSPSAIPSPPRRVRVFLQSSAGNLSALVRWDAPADMGGVITEWRIIVSTSDKPDSTYNLAGSLIPLYYVVPEGLSADHIYVYTMQACSRAGCSNLSDPSTLNASGADLGVPRILFSDEYGNISEASYDMRDVQLRHSSLAFSPLNGMIVHLEAMTSPSCNTTVYIIRQAERSLIRVDVAIKENGTVLSLNVSREVPSGVLIDGVFVHWSSLALFYYGSTNGTSYLWSQSVSDFLTQRDAQLLYSADEKILAASVSASEGTISIFTGQLKMVSLEAANGSFINTNGPYQNCLCACSNITLATVDGDSQTLFYLVENTLWSASLDLTSCRVIQQLQGSHDWLSISVWRNYVYLQNAEDGVLVTIRLDESDVYTLEKLSFSALTPLRQMSDHPDVPCRRAPPLDAVTSNVTATGVVLTAHARSFDTCLEALPPAVFYSFTGLCDGELRTLMLSSSVYECTGLSPNTEYTYTVTAYTAYSYIAGLGSDPLNITFTTTVGVPSQPNVAVYSYLPTELRIEWEAPPSPLQPADALRFILRYESNESGVTTVNLGLASPYLLHNLEPSTLYKVMVISCGLENLCTNSNYAENWTYAQPNSPFLRSVTKDRMTLSWTAPRGNDILSHRFRYYLLPNPKNFTETYQVNTIPSVTFNVTIPDLQPASLYGVQISLIYKTFQAALVIPESPLQVCTAGTVPNSAAVTAAKCDAYLCSFKTESPSCLGSLKLTVNCGEWSQTFVVGKEDLIIRRSVLPSDIHGCSAVVTGSSPQFSDTQSAAFALEDQSLTTQSSSKEADMAAILGSLMAVLLVLLCSVIAVVLWYRRRKRRKNDRLLVASVAARVRSIRSPDMELVSLRNGALVLRSNALYQTEGALLSPLSDSLLVEFDRSNLKLTRFLGGGAFGEVYAGLAKDLEGAVGDTAVAVKTLKPGASETNKEQFVKEAQLMSLFKNDFIVRLLGVCLANEPYYIILELMENGDLVGVLRESRPNKDRTGTLGLKQLVGLCRDVAAGCKYLEKLHFVHRDLAARNCLVTSLVDGSHRVKLADFGLARDIYHNDYYRKEGEALLPVRWMSPESLIDGVFTTQSDIWAFGVLMWEIFTLAMQPYPARSNLEVLQFVTNSGTLDRPARCPQAIFAIMAECWSYSSQARPSFEDIHAKLDAFISDRVDPEVITLFEVANRRLVSDMEFFSGSSSTAQPSPTTHNPDHFSDVFIGTSADERAGSSSSPISSPVIADSCEQEFVFPSQRTKMSLKSLFRKSSKHRHLLDRMNSMPPPSQRVSNRYVRSDSAKGADGISSVQSYHDEFCRQISFESTTLTEASQDRHCETQGLFVDMSSHYAAAAKHEVTTNIRTAPGSFKRKLHRQKLAVDNSGPPMHPGPPPTAVNYTQVVPGTASLREPEPTTAATVQYTTVKPSYAPLSRGVLEADDQQLAINANGAQVLGSVTGAQTRESKDSFKPVPSQANEAVQYSQITFSQPQDSRHDAAKSSQTVAHSIVLSENGLEPTSSDI